MDPEGAPAAQQTRPDGARLHGREAVRAYWARQFAAGHPLVGLDRL
ncbi:hypothetical protein [Streptomyces sp. NPDC057301]